MLEPHFVPSLTRMPHRRSANGDARTNPENTGQGGGSRSPRILEVAMVVGRDPMGLGYVARFETPAGSHDEVVAWEDVVAIR